MWYLSHSSHRQSRKRCCLASVKANIRMTRSFTLVRSTEAQWACGTARMNSIEEGSIRRGLADFSFIASVTAPSFCLKFPLHSTPLAALFPTPPNPSVCTSSIFNLSSHEPFAVRPRQLCVLWFGVLKLTFVSFELMGFNHCVSPLNCSSFLCLFLRVVLTHRDNVCLPFRSCLCGGYTSGSSHRIQQQ
jgi:hypothetical protein